MRSTRAYRLQAGNSARTEQLKDDPGYVLLHIDKKDSATLGDAQTGATLEGAEYKVTSLSTPGWEQTVSTNKDGYVLVTDVPFGKITVQEIKAPKGYKLDTEIHTYEVHPGEGTNTGTVDLVPEVYFKQNPVSCDIESAKTKGGEDDSWESDDGQGHAAAGVQFQIVSNTTNKVVGTLTTNDAELRVHQGRGHLATRPPSPRPRPTTGAPVVRLGQAQRRHLQRRAL
ncbi:MAG: prealbumin-like fold domain-containing protein [Eggerthellaceae bacterium]